jgi:PhnB protein
MSAQLNPYLHFNGNAEEALHFYSKVFGVEPVISRYGDNPAPDLKEEDKNKVMHGDINGDGVRLMISDSGPMGDVSPGSNYSLSLSGTAADAEKLTEYFTKLSEGGKVTVPLSKAGWGDTFGMLEDKYGFGWLVNIAAEQQ